MSTFDPLVLLPFARGLGILVVAHLVGRYLRGPLSRVLDGRLDATLRSFLVSAVYPVLIALAVPAALEQVGVSITSIIALLSTVGLAIAIALKDSLSNVASGALILTTRPFKVDDEVTVAGITGRVRRIRVLTTEIDTDDGRRVNVTNDKVLASPMEHHAAEGFTRIEVILRVHRSQVDTSLVERLSRAAANATTQGSGHVVVPLDFDGDIARIAVRATLPATRADSARVDLFLALAAAMPSTDDART
jgi:small-conductance mechanosensitive channel